MSQKNVVKHTSNFSLEHAEKPACTGSSLEKGKDRGSSEYLNHESPSHKSSIGEADALRLEKRTKLNVTLPNLDQI